MPRIGLALGSGSARGWAHIGVIEALGEAGIEPDIVCGCSIGSLVGAAYVSDRLPALKDFAESVTWRQIMRMLDVRMAGGGFISGKQIVKLLRKMKIAGPIADRDKAFAAIATDLESGGEVCLGDGPIEDAVRASISLPGILSPARVGGQWLVDGGLVNPVPVSACRALGAEIVIAVNLNDDLAGRLGRVARRRGLLGRVPARLRARAAAIMPKLIQPSAKAPGYFEVLLKAIYIMQDQITRASLAGDPPDVLLAPRLSDIGFLEFNRAAEAIAAGRACVAEASARLRRL